MMGLRVLIIGFVMMGVGCARSQGLYPVSDAPVQDLLAFPGEIYFDTAATRSEQMAHVGPLVDWAKAHVSRALVLEGHCDERGSDEYNLELGDRRARSVKAYLMAQGVRGERLLVVSRGERIPLAHEHSEWAWKQNRRVSIYPIP